MKKYLITILVVIGVIGFIYSDFITGGMERTSQDYIKQAMPINQFVDSEKDGIFNYPLWYNDIFGGMPFQASGTYHIKLNLESVVRGLMPASVFSALDGRFTFHLLLGFVLMVLVLRKSYKLEFIPSVAGGFAYILCSHILGTEHVNRISTFVYVPMVFWGAKEIFASNKLLGAFILSLGLGFQLNSYHQQITYYTMLFIGFYFLWQLFVNFKDKKIFDKKSSGIFVGSVAMALLMGLVAIWPLQDYLAYSARGVGMDATQKYQWMTNWCFSPKSVFDFIFPHFEGFAHRTPVDVNGVIQNLPTYWGSMPFTDYPHYLGVVVVLLAIFGLMGIKKCREVQFLAISTVIFLFLSFGRDLPLLYDLFYNIVPYFDKFRSPSLLLIILEFNFAVLAAIGLNNIITKYDELEIFKFSKRVAIGATAFFVLTLVLSSPIKNFMFDLYNASGKGHEQLNVFRYELLQLDFLRFIVFVLLTHLAIYLIKIKPQFSKTIIPVAIVALIVIDLTSIGTKLVHGQYKKGTSLQTYKRAENNTVKFLLEDKSKFRIYPIDNFSENMYGYWRIETIGGYHAAKTAYIQKIIDSRALFNRGVIDMLNVKYVLSLQDLSSLPAFASMTQVKQFGKQRIYQNNADLGRFFFASKFDEVSSDEDALKRLTDPSFNPVNSLFMQGKINGKLDNLSSNATGKITKYSSNKISLEVDAKTNTILVLSEVYYPKGWEVYVDGEKKEINRTNYLLRSVFIEQGKHKVEFKFEPISFRISIIISLVLMISLSLIFVVFIANKYYFQKRKKIRK